MRSRWEHSICESCWKARNPDRVPHRVIGDLLCREFCCFCGDYTNSGIYVRQSPEGLICMGIHDSPPLVTT